MLIGGVWPQNDRENGGKNAIGEATSDRIAIRLERQQEKRYTLQGKRARASIRVTGV